MGRRIDHAARRRKLVKILEALPEVTVEEAHDHLRFFVRKKRFGYYLNDHHGDGKIAITCKAPPGEQAALLEWDPVRFYSPPYMGPRGWIALRLDLPDVDWEEVAEILQDAYRMAAPKTLVARLEPPPA